jgi:hypothetical protein
MSAALPARKSNFAPVMSIERGDASADAERHAARLIMTQLVTIAETDLMAHTSPTYGHPGRNGGEDLSGFCYAASDVLVYHARTNNHAAGAYHVRDVHAFFGDRRGEGRPIQKYPFSHALGVVQVRNTVFLGDLTFGQFCYTSTVRQGTQNTGFPSYHPLALQLIRDCFVELTDDTLRTYLRLTTGAREPDTRYVEASTVNRLITSLPPADPAFPDEAIASGLMWHDTPCDERLFPCLRPEPLVTDL